MRRSQLCRVVGGLLSLVLLGALAGPAQAVTMKGAGVVIALRGEAEVRRPPAPAAQPLKFKDDVFWKDVLTTKTDSRMRVLLEGKTVVSLGPVARMELQQPVEQVGVKKTILQMVSGLARIVFDRTVEPGREVEVHTLNAVAGVRGTILYLNVQPGPTAADTITTVSVEQGSATVTGATGQLNVAAGNQAILQGTQAPRLQPVPPGLFQQLLNAVQPPPPTQKGSTVSASTVQSQVNLTLVTTSTIIPTLIPAALAPVTAPGAAGAPSTRVTDGFIISTTGCGGAGANTPSCAVATVTGRSIFGEVVLPTTGAQQIVPISAFTQGVTGTFSQVPTLTDPSVAAWTGGFSGSRSGTHPGIPAGSFTGGFNATNNVSVNGSPSPASSFTNVNFSGNSNGFVSGPRGGTLTGSMTTNISSPAVGANLNANITGNVSVGPDGSLSQTFTGTLQRPNGAPAGTTSGTWTQGPTK